MPPPLRVVLTLASLVGALYLAVCLLLFFTQRSLIYFPHPPSAAGAAAGALTLVTPEGERVQVTTRPRPGRGAVLYFGGNAEDTDGSLPDLEAAFPEHALYLTHYRAYGASTGEPSERALVADALALFDRVHPEHPQIVAIGRSLGSGVAVQLAAARPVSRLVLVTPFNSLADLAARQYPMFPVRLLMRDRFDSFRYAPKVAAPTLLLAAGQDEIIPLAQTEALRLRFPPGLSRIRLIHGTGHNTIQESAEYARLLAGVL